MSYNNGNNRNTPVPNPISMPSLPLPMMGAGLFPIMPIPTPSSSATPVNKSKLTHIVQKPMPFKKLVNKHTNAIVKQNPKKKYKFKFQDKLYKMYNFDPRVDVKQCPFYNYKRPERHDPDWFLGNKDNGTEDGAANNSSNGGALNLRENRPGLTKDGSNYGVDSLCPFGKHISGKSYNKLVCAHWLKGLCKKNDQCEYLHEFNMRRMQDCSHYQEYGVCTGLLLGEEEKIEDIEENEMDIEEEKACSDDENATNAEGDKTLENSLSEEERKIRDEKKIKIVKNELKRRKECYLQHIDKETGYMISPYIGTAGGFTSIGLGSRKDIPEDTKFILSQLNTDEIVINKKLLNTYPPAEENKEKIDYLLKERRIIKCKVKVKNKKTGKLKYKYRFKQVCESYKLGFCYMGPYCKFKHVHCKLCPRYLNGFCPLGNECTEGEHIPSLNNSVISDKLMIKPDKDLLSKSSDAKEQARLMALINGE